MNSSSSFEKFILDLIPAQLPTVYLEGYDALVKKLIKLIGPNHQNQFLQAIQFMGTSFLSIMQE